MVDKEIATNNLVEVAKNALCQLLDHENADWRAASASDYPPATTKGMRPHRTCPHKMFRQMSEAAEALGKALDEYKEVKEK
jgi:hypothetical protein